MCICAHASIHETDFVILTTAFSTPTHLNLHAHVPNNAHLCAPLCMLHMCVCTCICPLSNNILKFLTTNDSAAKCKILNGVDLIRVGAVVGLNLEMHPPPEMFISSLCEQICGKKVSSTPLLLLSEQPRTVAEIEV